MLMKQKVCVVTGAASPQGIGNATARMLAANGAHVALVDVSANVGDAARKIAADHPASRARSIVLTPLFTAPALSAPAPMTRSMAKTLTR